MPCERRAEPAGRIRRPSMTAFGWAILGTGAVSSHFVSGLRNSAFDARAVTVVSRTRANAERFAGSFGVPHVSESYEAACASPGVDAVYVATPPSAHEAHALAAISAGKPVLLEKPFAMDAASANRIAGAARSAGVFCMEAMWTRFLPLTRYMKRMVDSGAIGEIRAFTGSFSTAVRPGSRTGIFEAGSGGGALTYRGVYPLSLACLVMGPVTEAHTVAVFGDTGVDEDTIVASRHRTGVSTIQTGLRTNAANDFRIMGTTGTIHVEAPIYRPFRLRCTPVRPGGAPGPDEARKRLLGESRLAQGLIRRVRGPIGALRKPRGRTITKRFAGNGYHYEADELMRSVRAGRTESGIFPLEESLIVMEALDKARASWS